MRSVLLDLLTRLKSPFITKAITFAVIGIGNALIDLAVFTLCYNLASLPLVLSNVLAWVVAVSASYVMNSMITFRVESGRELRLKDYLRFAASGILGVTAATATLVALSYVMPVIYAKLLSILAAFVVNFAMSNFVVFRPRANAERTDA